MVKFKNLIKIINIYTSKHHDYPKINAIHYYNENKRKFKKEKWDEKYYTDEEKYSSIPGHLFTQQNELQKNVQYDELEKTMIQSYQSDAFFALSYYHYGEIEKLREQIRHSSMMWMASMWGSRYDMWHEQPENITEMLDGFVNDPNPDNWFFDNRIPMKEALVYDEKTGESYYSDKELSEWSERRWSEIYQSIKHPEKMTPQDWQKVYEENDAPSKLTMKDWSEGMHHLIEQSPRIQTDCIAWRYGELPVDLIKEPSWNPKTGDYDGPEREVRPMLREGLTGTFKGFTGLTYNEKLIQRGSYLKDRAGWTDGSKDRYKIKFIIPHGTKGVVLGDSIGCDSFQNELLLDRNQKFVIHEIDEKRKTATIILY